ncbi:hypothetical protein IFM89_010849 [Coptis chinensis]|uniref:RING-type E3 ubiquitin transferase n=1 Tax=Coptis chinensis TaxID=261450 RepID=A0A835I261_9MAGN|nr:hypothetical protein IFM89_010849 [Coptis chinensis]
MGERNMVCTSQVVDMDIDQQAQGHIHPDHCFFVGNNAHLPHPSMYPVLSASGSASNIDMHHFANSHDSSMFYGSHFNGLQHRNPVTNMDLGVSSNFHSPCMIPPPVNRVFPISHVSCDQLPYSSHHGIAAVGISDFGGNHQFMDGVRNSGKRKNAEGVPGSYLHVNASASSSSASLCMPPPSVGILQSEGQLESGAAVLEATASVPPEYGVNGVSLISGGGSARSVRSRGLQVESPMLLNPNHLAQGNYINQSFQPAAWVEQQFGTSASDGSTSSWNYTPMHYLNVNRRLVLIKYREKCQWSFIRNCKHGWTGIYGRHEQQKFYSSLSSSYAPPPFSSSSSPPMQAMHVHNNFHIQATVPSFRHTTSNTLHHGTINHSPDDLEIGSRHPRPLPPNRIYRPHRSGVHHAVPVNSNRPHLRYMSEDEVAILEIPGFYEVGNLIDRHRDMRLDIDDMSYESNKVCTFVGFPRIKMSFRELELLALGEQIGSVITGLPEETILRHLKTRVYISSASKDMNNEVETGTCIVCQVEYRNQEKVGTLGCGHEYHADCIKKWLQVKNVCPICKVQAISVEDG